MRPTHPPGLDSTAAQAPARERGYSPWLVWLIWVLWLGFLWQPISALLLEPPSVERVISLLGIVVFIGLYLWITWREASRLSRETPPPEDTDWRSWIPIATLLALALTMIALRGPQAQGSLIYVSAAMCGRLSAWRAAFAAAGLTALDLLLGALTGVPLGVSLQVVLIVFPVGLFVYFFSHAIHTNQELRRARQEIARLAVSEERLRFARDLHDLLGRTLSLIALKSELARRLVNAAPEQAISEIGDIETAARQALSEVREAVAAYRQPTLQGELSGASDLLAAAGIAYRQRGAPPPLAPATEAALAWALREGVTNVIRHSHARSCEITLGVERGPAGEQARLEVRDVGDGSVAEAPTTPTLPAGGSSGGVGGSGLAGVRERVAALGGDCETGPAPEGGWRLLVTLPLATGEQQASGASPATDESQREERRVTAWFG